MKFRRSSYQRKGIRERYPRNVSAQVREVYWNLVWQYTRRCVLVVFGILAVASVIAGMFAIGVLIHPLLPVGVLVFVISAAVISAVAYEEATRRGRDTRGW